MYGVGVSVHRRETSQWLHAKLEQQDLEMFDLNCKSFRIPAAARALLKDVDMKMGLKKSLYYLFWVVIFPCVRAEEVITNSKCVVIFCFCC